MKRFVEVDHYGWVLKVSTALPHTQTYQDKSLLTVTVLPMHGSVVNIVCSIVHSLMVSSDNVVCQTGSHIATTCSPQKSKGGIRVMPMQYSSIRLLYIHIR